jgi:hypothetical protein
LVKEEISLETEILVNLRLTWHIHFNH